MDYGRYRVLLCALILLAPSAPGWAAPSDFDGDGVSDPAVVVAGNPLRWEAQTTAGATVITPEFGALGVHLAAAHYTGTSRTEPAYISSNGTWSVLLGTGATASFSHGAPGSTYFAGADIDGDGKADALYHTNTCTTSRTELYAVSDPLGPQLTRYRVQGGSGRFFSTYGDTNGDGKDEFCSLAPVRDGRAPRGRFRMTCKDVTTGAVAAQLNVGKVYTRPIPVKSGTGKSDRFALAQEENGTTIVRVLNAKGRLLQRVVFPATGYLLVGNYLSSGTGEQLAIAANDRLLIFNPTVKSFVLAAIPAGIAFDEFNANHFPPLNDNCICTSTHLERDARCPPPSSGEGGTGGNIEGACEVNREISDGWGGWLHKGRSDVNPSMADLFRAEEDPQQCRYEDTGGKLFVEAFFNGRANPDRPTWRPVGLPSCTQFPKPLVVACLENGKKNCWRVPDPCGRYD